MSQLRMPAEEESTTGQTMEEDPFVSETKRGHLGLTTLYESSGAVVDIIFVHGLNGDSMKSWTKDGTCWPYDLLPKDLPNSRILTWGYDSRIPFFETILQSLPDHAKNLLYGISRIRLGTSRARPLIFISHGLGGLVVKQALLDARSSPGQDGIDFNPIFRSTAGLIFLGTARHSKGGASLYMTLLPRIISKTNKHFLQALSANSSILNLLSAQLSTTSKDIPIICFVEQHSTPRVGFIVLKETAYLDGAEMIPLPYDYIEMGKFSSNQDIGYTRIVDIIQRLVKQSTKATSPGNIQKKAEKIRGPPKKVLSKSQAQLKAVGDLAEKIRETFAEHAPAEGFQPLATELVYFSQVIQSLSQLQPANNLSAALKVIMQIKDSLQLFSERFDSHVTSDTNVTGTISSTTPNPGDMRDLQDKISRNLTTVNTLLILSSLSQAGRPSHQSLLTYNGTNKAAPLFDSFSLKRLQGGGDKSQVADEWFSYFEQCKKVVEVRQDHDYRKVRVAVLDTGLDPAHRHRVKDYVGFTAASKDCEAEDLAGHGTFVTDLLLQIAPNAEIYVARVFDGEMGDEDTASCVAKAIRYAASDPWDVDIISMSFGFSTGRQPEIASAIGLPQRRPIIMFAAASNTGALGTPCVSYPASYVGHVFCINSSDGHGVASNFTPPPKDNSDNFSMLGEDVRAAFPESLLEEAEPWETGSQDGKSSPGEENSNDSSPGFQEEHTNATTFPEMRMSGTSMATPIAAGTAALVIEFARQHPELISEDDLASIEDFDGMHQILRFMSREYLRNGYYFIKPWELLQEGRSSEMIACLIRYALSKH